VKNLKILSPEILRKYTKPNTVPTLSIVGNGGVSLEDEDRINSSDCIVRFNNYATREKISKTKDPFKCDILFSTFDLHSQGSNPDHVVAGIPAPFNIKTIPPKMSKWYPRSGHWMVNPYDNAVLCEELELESLGFSHPLPSIGLTALYHLSKLQCNMFICSMNWYYNEQTGLFQNHHLSSKKYSSNWNHNYPKEIGWILHNLYSKPGVSFSKSCERLLTIARKQLNEM
jgi:hypothetical protein